MNKLTAIVFLILLFPIPVFLFSQEKQSYSMLINQINELYASIEDNEVWEQRTNALADLLVSFFQTPESLTCDIKTSFPFIYPIFSEDNAVRMYSWYKKNGGRVQLFDSILQCKLSTKNIYVKRMKDSVRYYDIFPLTNNIFLFCGDTETGSLVRYLRFLSIKINDINVSPYNAFDNTDMLSFSYVDELSLDNIDFLVRGRIIDVSYNFRNTPFTLKLTYAKPKNFIDETKEAEDNIFSKEFEFIFDGKEFVGDYSLFDPDFTLDTGEN